MKKQFNAKKLEEGFSLLEQALKCFEIQDSDQERFKNVSLIARNSLLCYKTILQEKKQSAKQTSIKNYFNHVEKQK